MNFDRLYPAPKLDEPYRWTLHLQPLGEAQLRETLGADHIEPFRREVQLVDALCHRHSAALPNTPEKAWPIATQLYGAGSLGQLSAALIQARLVPIPTLGKTKPNTIALQEIGIVQTLAAGTPRAALASKLGLSDEAIHDATRRLEERLWMPATYNDAMLVWQAFAKGYLSLNPDPPQVVCRAPEDIQVTLSALDRSRLEMYIRTGKTQKSAEERSRQRAHRALGSLTAGEAAAKLITLGELIIEQDEPPAVWPEPMAVGVLAGLTLGHTVADAAQRQRAGVHHKMHRINPKLAPIQTTGPIACSIADAFRQGLFVIGKPYNQQDPALYSPSLRYHWLNTRPHVTTRSSSS